MNICMAFSPNWSEYAAISLFALLSTNKPPIQVYLLSDKLDEKDYLMLNKIFNQFKGCEYTHINMTERFSKSINNKNVNTPAAKYTLYRLFLPQLIEEEDRVLYLDADTVVNADISSFYDMNMQGNWIIGCTDTGLQKNYKTVIGLKENDFYINAGVFLMDLKKIRYNRTMIKWLKLINEKFYLGHDQDVLNIACAGHIGVVSPEYNTSLSTSLNVGNVKIMHYAGKKPWNTQKVPGHDIWERWKTDYGYFLGSYNPQIPRIIHYCWFGRKEKPDTIKKCVASWGKQLKNFLIIEWNEDNFDVNIHPFVREAYGKKLYAFVNDWARMWIMYHYGGVTLDADVEILRPLDKFLAHRCFTGHEVKDIPVCAVIGSVPGHPWVKMILDNYDNLAVDKTPNTQIIKNLSQKLIKCQKDGLASILDDVIIYPAEVFAPYDHCKHVPTPTSNSYAIHHFCGSWLKDGE